MPIYPYVCTACGHEFDALQKISDDPLTECPACDESGLRKRLAAPAFQLKGTGWYETDFKNSGKGKQASGKNDDGDKGSDKKVQAGKSQGESQGESQGGDRGSSSGGDSKSAAAGAKDD